VLGDQLGEPALDGLPVLAGGLGVVPASVAADGLGGQQLAPGRPEDALGEEAVHDIEQDVLALARDPWRTRAVAAAASNSALVTSGSCVGVGDHTHSDGGLQLPPFLEARRFHTMSRPGARAVGDVRL
jgi:hypothetical protein